MRKEWFMNKICIPVIIPSYEPDENLIILCENLYNAGITETIIFDDGSGGGTGLSLTRLKRYMGLQY